jgi:O-antigen/teichoic acid export membrane protein
MRTAESTGRTASVLAILSLGQTGTNVAAGLVATILLAVDQRGVMVVGMTIAAIFGVIGGLGTGAAFRAHLPRADAASRRRLGAAYAWVSIAAAVPVVALALVACALTSALVSPQLAEPGCLLGVGAYVLGLTVLGQVADGWYAQGEMSRGGVSAASATLGGMLGCFAMLWLHPTAGAVLLGQGLGMLAPSVLAVGRLRRAGIVSFGRPDPVAVGSLVRTGVPSLGIMLGQAVSYRADRYVVGAFCGPAVLAVYALAATLSELTRIIPTAVAQVLLRKVSVGAGAEHRVPALRQAAVGSLPAAVVVGMAGWVLIPPIFGGEFAAARWLLIPLLAAEIVFAPCVVAQYGLLGGGWTRTVGLIGLVGGACAIPVYALGAALGAAEGVAAAAIALYGALSWVTWRALRTRVSGPDARLAELAVESLPAPRNSTEEEECSHGPTGR